MKKIVLFLNILILASCDFSDDEKNHQIINNSFSIAETKKLSQSELTKLLNEITWRVNELSVDTIKKDYYYRLANLYWNNGNYSFYKKFVLKGIVESQSVNSEFGLARGYRKIGEYYCRPPFIERDSAYYFLKKSANIYFEKKDYASLANVDLMLGNNSFFSGDFTESEMYALKALDYFKNTSKNEKIASCYTLLGISNLESKNFSQAGKYLKEANELIRKKTNNNWDRAVALNNLGKCYLEQFQFDLAKDCFVKGLHELQGEKDPLPMALLMENLAIVESKINIQNPDIPNWFLKAIILKDSLKFEEVRSRINFSNYYLQKGDSTTAKLKAEEAAKISELKGLKDRKLAVEQLLKVERKAGQNRVHQFLSLAEELNHSELVLMRNILKINRDFDSSTRLKDKQLYLRQKIIFVLCLVLTIAIILGLIWFVLNRKRQIKWLQKERQMSKEIYHLMEQQYIDAAARNDEKKRIAGDLHDSIINSLTVIRLNLNLLGIKCKEETMKETFIYVNQIQEVEKQIRAISYDTYFSTNGLDYGIQQMLKEIISHKKVLGFKGTVNLNLSDKIPWVRLNMKEQFNLFAILREGLLNALKHSSASRLELKGYYKSDSLEFEINDNGVGFNTKSQGLGMENMFNRAKKLNAILQINSEINGGTIILLNLKL
ncbi:hypothetical protein HUK80_10615 [Flavobacterium sp. MAH-1]|uniref:Signal transduction histidine kinase subgroup 3 dimerisation and phosphoacceptor domain-containing protein n=1 Tax=Flavobacterium agri TaxID=2743471 RepID=A0A7Y9C6F0_9FLAO|nr:tetratricopeptide repeat-containing sensor histidine kinase [Flavobacterium agri]NUY81350.1 hypothetical protein [Flavobacterium agri]NYA71374.1 hypothetical protein [Flavobacterium agri]